MLLPDKHLPLGRSVLGVGSMVLSQLADGPKNLEELVSAVGHSEDRQVQDLGSLILEVILALDFLFALEVVELIADGTVARCD